MSIVVTCDCTMEYRLPDRYAGKACRCRECGGKIKVPRARSSAEERALERKKRKKKKKAKAKVKAEVAAEKPKSKKKKTKEKAKRKRKRSLANTTTRRLGPPQQAEILSERRTLRSSQRRSLPSESMHNLAPLRSGKGMDNMLSSSRKKGEAARKRRRKAEELLEPKRVKTKGKTKSKGKTKTKGKAKGLKGKAKDLKGKAKDLKGKAKGLKGKAKSLKTKGKAKGSKGKAKTAERPSRRKTERMGRGRPKRKGPARRTRVRGRRGDVDSDEEITVPQGGTKHALYAVIAIVGVLCLGIGVIVGGGVGLGGAVSSLGSGFDEDVKAIETLAIQRNWDAAKVKLDEVQKAAAGDSTKERKLSKVRVAVEMMVQLRGIEDEDQRMGTLCKYSVHDNALVRHGIAWELRPIAAGIDEAQEALANLARDNDKRVAEAAKQALVQAGGPYAVPYLEEAIVKYSATGGKQAEVALERALEVDDMAVVPVLMKVLEVRKSASADVLTRVIERIGEFGDPVAIPAVEPFTSHADEAVKTAATTVLEELKAAQG